MSFHKFFNLYMLNRKLKKNIKLPITILQRESYSFNTKHVLVKPHSSTSVNSEVIFCKIKSVAMVQVNNEENYEIRIYGLFNDFNSTIDIPYLSYHWSDER